MLFWIPSAKNTAIGNAANVTHSTNWPPLIARVETCVACARSHDSTIAVVMKYAPTEHATPTTSAITIRVIRPLLSLRSGTPLMVLSMAVGPLTRRVNCVASSSVAGVRRPPMRILGVLVVMVCASACSEPIDESVDDGDAELGSVVELGKGDASDFAGIYRWADASRPYWNNDIPSLQLAGSGYVRSRCFGFNCATLVPQFGDRKIVRVSGKVFVRFMSFTREWNADNEEWIETPVLADTYEIKKTTRGIKLRKTYTSRWISLDKITERQACTLSGGDWGIETPPCTCDAVANPDWSHYMASFPGLGGCFEIFAANEDGCSSTGSYTDDDATVIGTYCSCPLGTHETQAGCEAI
jgi:hypothetical protein